MAASPGCARRSAAEACRPSRRAETCAAPWADARRKYTALAAFDDTGPDALLGLARLGDVRRLDDLDRRFSTREARGRAGAAGDGDAAREDERARSRRSRSPSACSRRRIRSVASRSSASRRICAAASPVNCPPALTQRRTALDDRIAAARADARAAAELADDVPELVRDATTTWRGRPATREPARTLIYPGAARTAAWSTSRSTRRCSRSRQGTRPRMTSRWTRRCSCCPAGATPPPGMRTIAQVPLGEALPHLAIAIANPVVDPDPLDAVIRARARRHVAVTSALALALGLGLLVTIRGAARARELARLKSDFVSTVSHELKTPLTSIRMFAEMLEQGVARGDPDKMARYHGVIVQESQRLGLLIANLLDYAQIERGTRRYAPVRQGIDELARHATATFDTLRAADGGEARNPVTLDVSDQAMLADVEVDRDVVVQALLNLLANAAKYGGADKPIEVAVGADETTAWFAVRDHGPDIPAAEQARIFREFYRAPEAYRSGVEGTGLGLALVKRHVEALGGTARVASEARRARRDVHDQLAAARRAS